MVREIKKYVAFGAIVLPLVILWSCGSPKPGTKHDFFRTPRNLLPISTISVDDFIKRESNRKTQRHVDGDFLDTGCRLVLSGSKTFEFEPKIIGKSGFYCYLHLLGEADESIDFTLEQKDESGHRQIVGEVSDGNYRQAFFADLELKSGDVLQLTFKGNGIAFFSPPLTYLIKAEQERRNIIVIGLDTMRADQVGKQVNGRSITPHLDAFLKDAVCFERTYSQTSWTLPSFMSFFTGLYEYNHEVSASAPLSATKSTLVEPFSREFLTFGIHGGKVMKGRWGFDRGFDFYQHHRFAGALFKKGGQALFTKGFNLIESGRFPHLFLFLHTYQVHAPYTPPLEYLTPLNPSPKYTTLDAVNLHEPAKTYIKIEEEQERAMLELYQAEIFAFDAYFGEFIARLKAAGLYQNAMIVFVSDHGEEFYEHKGWTHSHGLYDEQIRVPLFMKFPGNRFAGTRVNKPTGVLDVLPTLLDYYGIGLPESEGQKEDVIDGRSLMAMLETGAGREPEMVVSSISTSRYFEAAAPKIALCYDHFKLIYNYPYSEKDLNFFRKYQLPPETPQFELYDLDKDGGETQNLFTGSHEIMKKMMPELLLIKKQIDHKLKNMKANKKLDKEAEAQLKSLGYL